MTTKVQTEEVIYVAPPDMVVDPEAKDILRRAYELVKRPWGWTRGKYKKQQFGKDSYCVLGAIGTAWDGDPYAIRSSSYHANDSRGAEYRAAEYFAKIIGKNTPMAVIGWNDDPMRRKAHVLAVFEELIKD